MSPQTDFTRDYETLNTLADEHHTLVLVSGTPAQPALHLSILPDAITAEILQQRLPHLQEITPSFENGSRDDLDNRAATISLIYDADQKLLEIIYVLWS